MEPNGYQSEYTREGVIIKRLFHLISINSPSAIPSGWLKTDSLMLSLPQMLASTCFDLNTIKL